MSKKQVNFVVTDLDDTIWDWLKMWYNSFNPYLEKISTEFSIDLKVLKDSFKRLHQKYGTTESSFIYEELDCLTITQKEKMSMENDSQKSIIHEYYSNKKRNLYLYDGVLDTLKTIKGKGSMIVGFTESNAFFTKYRIKHLGLDGIIDCIYAPVDSGVPGSVNKYYKNGYWEPEKTEFRYLSKKVRKPDSEILEIILKDFIADKETTFYIGDKLDRDIYMAQQASITSVYAAYGHLIDVAEYSLLREVTHWTEADVQREIDFKNNYHVNPKPDYELTKSFSELNEIFSFFDFSKKNRSDGK